VTAEGAPARWPVLLAVGLAAAAALFLTRPPSPRGADAPEEEFSAARAMEHVRRIAAEPHPVGSEAHGEVLSYLLEELGKLGLDPEEQVAEFTAPGTFLPRGTVRNVIARVPGRGGGGLVALVSHYDSVPMGPGAADDGAAVAAVLETVRALAAGPPLANDLLVLITDGEEIALCGARAFVGHDPRAKELDLVLNFEARGNAGRSLMFQTSLPNAWLLEAYGAACGRPAASSIMAAVYREMPNDTDFTVFDEAGVPGLNFACIEGYTAYHAPEDTPENLSEATLQHHGESMLATVRRFGAHDFADRPEGDVVYFDYLSRILVVYRQGLVGPVTAAAVLLFAGLVWIGRRRGRVALLPALGGLGLQVVAVGATVAAVWALSGWLADHFEVAKPRRVPGTTADAWFFLGFTALAAAVFALVAGAPGRRLGPANVLAGSLALWAGLLVAATIVMPGAHFLFLVPLACGLGGLVTLLFERSDGTAAAGLTIPAVLLLAPLCREFFAAMALAGAWIVVPVAALGVGLLAPVLGGRGWGLRCAGFAAATVALLAAGFLSA